MSASEAIRIAKAAWPVSKAKYVISSYPTSKSPYYWVDVLNTDNYIGPGGMVKINAITGEVLKGT
ncbi:PepSY domain-containing protein [Methanobacterium sp. VT]|uniref:PepSY domain-containing protein n=1 Tax=Methanobacterium spitsbergense TaxID=2874285 RepID=A0A8T5UXP1_9EURY|nr:PepSY domain-containing protein [Methanobacterium spitsbergense]